MGISGTEVKGKELEDYQGGWKLCWVTSCPEPREEGDACDPHRETKPTGLGEVSEATDIPVEDTEVDESESDEALGSKEEAVEPPDPPVKMPRTRGTHYSLRGLIKPPQRFS